MLKLVELIRMSDVHLGRYKIHCAVDDQRSGWRPLDQYYSGTFEWGQARQSGENFKCENVLSLINLSNSQKWLFVGVYRVGDVTWDPRNKWFLYELERVEGLEHLDGRVVVDFPKTFRASYLRGESYGDHLLVSSIREEPMSIADFPGFNSVLLSFEMLCSIVRQDHPSWRTALSNIAGVYLISDRKTGYQYVGSAYGGVGLWQRWSEYANTGHGGTKELRKLLHDKGVGYMNHFQFSLVEVCDISASDDFIISRESHWKDVLLSREFGYNCN
ncbi:MAG: GIY-YIG nuclease family protein [Pirellulales bacterium]|nr:GIY-YIG nuclease family protein [Pirellulales bacterium]